MYTPAWNKALNTGTQIAWVSAVWAPGVLTTAAPDTKGKWAMAPLPQWTAGENNTGSWGGSSTGVTTDSKHKAAATVRHVAEHRPGGRRRPGEGGRHLPGRHRRPDRRGALPGRRTYFSNQPDFYTEAAKIAPSTAGRLLGPERERRVHRLQGHLRARPPEQDGLRHRR